MEDIKKVLKALFSTVGAVDKATENGIGVDDIPLFIAPVTLLPGAIEGAPGALAAFKGLDEAGRAEVLAYAKQEFNLRDEKLEAVIERALSWAAEGVNVVMDVKALIA